MYRKKTFLQTSTYITPPLKSVKTNVILIFLIILYIIHAVNIQILQKEYNKKESGEILRTPEEGI